MHDAKAFGWKLGEKEHDWETMVETVQNHVKMLNFRYRVGLKSAQVGWVGGSEEEDGGRGGGSDGLLMPCVARSLVSALVAAVVSGLCVAAGVLSSAF